MHVVKLPSPQCNHVILVLYTNISQNRLPPRFRGCFVPRCPPLLIIATLRFRSSSLSSSLDVSTVLRFALLGGWGGDESDDLRARAAGVGSLGRMP